MNTVLDKFSAAVFMDPDLHQDDVGAPLR